MGEARVSAEHFVWLMGSLRQALQLPWHRSLLQTLPASLDRFKVIELSREAGIQLEPHALSKIDWGRTSFPIIAFDRTANDAPDRATVPTIIVRADDKRVLYFEPDNRHPKVALIDDLEARLDPYVYEPQRLTRTEDEVPRFGYAWFARELLRYKPAWRDVIAATLCIQLVGLAMPLFTQVIIDKVVVHQTQSTLSVVALGLVISVAFGLAFSWLRQYLALHTGTRVDAALGSQAFWHLLRVPLRYFSNRPTGTLVARLNGVEAIREFLSGAAVSVLLDIPFVVIFLAAMLWYSWQLTIIALALLGAVAAVSAVVTPILRKRLNRQFMLGARNQAFLTEHIAGIETVKTLQMEKRLHERYDDLLAEYLAAGFAARMTSGTFNAVTSGLEQLMSVAILCVGALLVMESPGFTIGMLIAFQMFASRLSTPIMRLAALWQDFQQASIAVRRLADIMEAPVEQHDQPALRQQRAAGRIEISRLRFHYEGRSELLREFNATFEPGQLVLLTGPSGSGKSTLLKLLLGFEVPIEGEIRIDGLNQRGLSAIQLRACFGVVPQETTLFSGTVYENVLAANPSAEFNDVVQACRLAEIHDTIDQLPLGYNTLVGERGIGLSGGQKQRLSIARALLKQPAVLLFDEATSNLDAANAESLARTVNALKSNRTIVFVAHQAPDGLMVDKTVRLDGEPIRNRGAESHWEAQAFAEGKSR